jgi:hypothetical protein
MARTMTIDGATLREIRVVVSPSGKTAVQLSFTLLSGTTVVQEINGRDFTAKLAANELGAANSLITAMSGALGRLEL